MRFRFRVLRRVRVPTVPTCPGNGDHQWPLFGIVPPEMGLEDSAPFLSVLRSTLFTLSSP